MSTLRESLAAVRRECYQLDDIFLRPIADDHDLWYATVECRLKPGQEDYVNPAGFSIGRAWLRPEDHLPCVICAEDGRRIGYLIFRNWFSGDACSWSYYLDAEEQGKGYGAKAARLAVQVLRAAVPETQIRLAVEADNLKAQKLYRSIGFRKLDEMDGDDLIFVI